MFTYREFADGTHYYRQKVQRESNPDSDKDYEIARSENELAVLELSRTKDPHELANIFTHLDNIIETLDNSNPAEYEDCIMISAVFTYYKIIAQLCGLAATKLEEFYRHTVIDYARSSGGLIYRIQPEDTKLQILPWVRAKVPITDSPGKVRTIIHEAFVAMAALNPLRRLIPSFSYVFSYWSCGKFMYAEDSVIPTICNSPGTRPVLIYESNAGGKSLFNVLSSRGKDLTLNEVLSYLLQLMGALEMAHQYADYTHYDLHSGNILVQPLYPEEMDIEFLDYDLTTNERIIIIDNGLAYCTYERPKSLSPLRLIENRYQNADSIEIFADSNDVGLVDRLQSTRINNYGPVFNQMIGTHRNRSYPLGDVFRIFFDVYSLCDLELREELRPLVAHFFVDADMSQKLSGPVDHASSVVNDFSLPPFRDNLYSYRYADFGQVILKNYAEQVGTFIKPRKRRLNVKGVRLEDAFDWRNPSKSPNSNLFNIGIISLLVGNTLNLGEPEESEASSMRSHYVMQGGLIRELNRGTQWDIKEYETVPITLDLVVSIDFFKSFVENMQRCIILVQWIRIIYSNTRILYEALRIRGRPNPIEILASALRVEPEDIKSLATYCRQKRLPRVMKAIFREMMTLTERVEKFFDKFKTSHDDKSIRTNRINWYRSCLPSCRTYLIFALEWGNVPASFGELSLPPIEK